MHGSLPDSGFFAVNLDINLGGHFLLTDAFKKNYLAKWVNRGGHA